MKLIIDIDEENYKFIKDLQSLIIGGRGNCKTIQQNVINAIKNGTPYEKRPQGDSISRKYLKEKIPELWSHDDAIDIWIKKFDVEDLIDNAPDQWIPIKYRPLTVDERIAFAEHYGVEYCDTLEEKAFDCPMPKDGQEILISTSWGVVEDVADNDIDGEGFICYGLETNGDWDGVDAWMPKPEPYKKEGAEND